MIITNHNIRRSLQALLNNEPKAVPLRRWDVSRVTNFDGLFQPRGFDWELVLRSSFWDDPENQISDWDIGGRILTPCIRMNYMFHHNTTFNQPLRWDVSKVVEMRRMFGSASRFNQDLDHWRLAADVNVDHMFMNATQFAGKLPWIRTVHSIQCFMSGSALWQEEFRAWRIDEYTHWRQCQTLFACFDRAYHQDRLSSILYTTIIYPDPKNYLRFEIFRMLGWPQKYIT